jgi:Sugar (and other) transporter.
VLRLADDRLPADLRQHGTWAPALLLLARLIQGLSVGGEYGTTATYMSEVALRGQRGFFASFQYVTLIGGQLLAVLVVVILQQLLTEDELRAWGWRIPFVVGAIAALISLMLRRSLHETSSAETRKDKDAGTIKGLFRQPHRSVHYRAGLHRRWLADLLHLHHLHAEVPGQHGRHACEDRQLRDDRRAVPLHGDAAVLRHALRPHRPA